MQRSHFRSIFISDAPGHARLPRGLPARLPAPTHALRAAVPGGHHRSGSAGARPTGRRCMAGCSPNCSTWPDRAPARPTSRATTMPRRGAWMDSSSAVSRCACGRNTAAPTGVGYASVMATNSTRRSWVDMADLAGRAGAPRPCAQPTAPSTPGAAAWTCPTCHSASRQGRIGKALDYIQRFEAPPPPRARRRLRRPGCGHIHFGNLREVDGTLTSTTATGWNTAPPRSSTRTAAPNCCTGTAQRPRSGGPGAGGAELPAAARSPAPQKISNTRTRTVAVAVWPWSSLTGR